MRSQLILPITVTLLVIITCTWIALYDFETGDPSEHLGVCFLLGSLFGHSTLASGWVVLGPGGRRRIAPAAVWLLACPGAIATNLILYSSFTDSGIIWMSAAMLVLLVQLLAWPMRFWLGLRIGQPICDRERSYELLISRQFGIQHLMIVTTVVAFLIGAGRLMLPYLVKWLAAEEKAIFAFLIVAACILCIPLAFSILAMRKPVAPALVLLILIAFATYSEMPLLASLGMSRGGPDWIHISLINTFSILPVIIVCSALRLAGYQLLSMKHTDARTDFRQLTASP